MNAATTNTAAAATEAAAPATPKTKAAPARKSAALAAGTVSMMIDPTKIKRREGWNTRFDFGEIALLAKSIAHELEVNPSSGGLINDLRVERMAKADKEGFEFELIDGDRRLTAVEKLLKAGTKFPIGVPAKVEPTSAGEVHDRDQLVRMYTANTGKNFLPMEEALAFQRMKDSGMKQAEIEAATGRSHGVVARAFLLLKADKRLRDAVEAKQLSASQALAIQSAARGDAEELDRLITEALSATTKDQKSKAKKTVKKALRAKAQKEGRKLKIRALTDEQLSELGAKVSKLLIADMKALGLAEDTNLSAWLKGADAEVKLGYQFGILQGLLAAAGAPAELIAR